LRRRCAANSLGYGGDVASGAGFGVDVAGDVGRDSQVPTLQLDVLKEFELAEEQIGDAAVLVVGRAHGGEGKIAEESIGIEFALRTRNIGKLEELTDRGRDAGVLESIVDDRAGGYPGRDEDGGNPNTEAIKRKCVECTGIGGLRDEGGVRRAGGRWNVVVDTAVFVVDQENRGVGPKIGIGADGVVHLGDELLTGADIVVRMLVAGDGLAAAVGCRMVGIVGFDEAVVGESVLAASGQKVRKGAKDGRLILQQVDDLHGGAGLVVVKELAGVAGAKQASVDGLEGLALVEEVHAHLAEGRTVVGEGTVAYRGTRDGGEPAIENGILRGERAEA
jgi:hypothetical protein